MGTLYNIVDGLSPEARRLLGQAATAKWTAARTVAAIAEATGEEVKERTIARHLANLRAEAVQRAAGRAQMEDLLAAAQAGNASAADMIQALAMDRLMRDPDALGGGDPETLQKLGLAGEELKLKRRAIEVRERAVAVQEGRLRVLEEREKRAIAALSTEGKEQMTAEERIQEIRGIYGLR